MKRWPVNLSELMIARHFARGVDGTVIPDDVLSRMHDAAKFARETVESIVKTHDAIMADAMQTPLANARRSRTATWAQFLKATAALDAASTAGKVTIAGLKAAMALPVATTPLEAFAAADLGSALRSMPAAERRAILDEAVASKNKDVLRAIRPNAPWAAGLNASQLGMLEMTWQRTHFSSELDRISRLERAAADLHSMGTASLAWMGSIHDDEKIADAEKSERAAKAAEATPG